MEKLSENLAQLTDSQLYKRAQEYGLRAKQWLRKFEGLLPEVARRKLYKRRGFASIHKFAAKLGGMSHEKTDKILRLALRLGDKPALKTLLESGAASYSKIEKVAYVATTETEKEWAGKVLTMPKAALELYVQAVRKNRSEVTPGSNFLSVKNTQNFPGVPGTGTGAQLFNTLSIKISSELEYELRLVKQKLEKQRGETLGFAEVLQELLKAYNGFGHDKEILKQPSRKIIQLCPKCIKEKANDMAQYGFTQRNIPKEVKDLVIVRQNGKCAFPNCNTPPEIFHHTRRFTINQNHDPDYIVYLCAPHERLAHSGLIKNEEQTPCKWQILKIESSMNSRTKARIDEKVNAHRREQCLAQDP